MLRGSSRSGSGRRGSPSGGNRSSQPKGQIKDGKWVQYSIIKGSDGVTKYVGSTNNPTRRAAQHQQSGKMEQGDRMNVETRPYVPRESRKRRTRQVDGAPPEQRTEPATQQDKRRQIPPTLR